MLSKRQESKLNDRQLDERKEFLRKPVSLKMGGGLDTSKDAMSFRSPVRPDNFEESTMRRERDKSALEAARAEG